MMRSIQPRFGMWRFPPPAAPRPLSAVAKAVVQDILRQNQVQPHNISLDEVVQVREFHNRERPSSPYTVSDIQAYLASLEGPSHPQYHHIQGMGDLFTSSQTDSFNPEKLLPLELPDLWDLQSRDEVSHPPKDTMSLNTSSSEQSQTQTGRKPLSMSKNAIWKRNKRKQEKEAYTQQAGESPTFEKLSQLPTNIEKRNKRATKKAELDHEFFKKYGTLPKHSLLTHDKNRRDQRAKTNQTQSITEFVTDSDSSREHYMHSSQTSEQEDSHKEGQRSTTPETPPNAWSFKYPGYYKDSYGNYQHKW